MQHLLSIINPTVYPLASAGFQMSTAPFHNHIKLSASPPKAIFIEGQTMI